MLAFCPPIVARRAGTFLHSPQVSVMVASRISLILSISLFSHLLGPSESAYLRIRIAQGSLGKAGSKKNTSV